MADERIELTDLDVIARYSLAVRTATADRDDLIETLRTDLAWLESLGRAPRTRPAPPAKRGTKPATKTTTKKAPAKNATAKKATGRR